MQKTEYNFNEISYVGKCTWKKKPTNRLQNFLLLSWFQMLNTTYLTFKITKNNVKIAYSIQIRYITFIKFNIPSKSDYDGVWTVFYCVKHFWRGEAIPVSKVMEKKDEKIFYKRLCLS